MKTLLLLLCVVLAHGALFAQPLPAVHGRVYGQDEKGANLGPVPGAKIELLSAKSGTVIATTTADSPGGYFQIKDLPPADYAYRVTAAGFKTEDEKRGFKVPQTSLEYVHDFLLTRPPPKRERCDVPVLIVKRVSTGTNDADAVRLPAASASLILRPNSPKIATPPNQPFVASAKGDLLLKDLAVGEYSVAIEAPEAQPFIGILQVKCDSADQIVFELQPCDAVLHSFVRTLLRAGWGRSPAAKTAAAQAYQAAARGAGQNPALDYARALSQLSAGSYDEARKSLAAAIAQKPEPVTHRASEMQLWMSLILHQPTQALRDARTWSRQLPPDASSSPAARDTAHLCGIALGLIQGPWKQDVPAGEAVLFERDLLAALPGDLRPQVEKARDSVTATFAKLKAGADSERGRLAAEAGEKMKAAVARIEARQTAIEGEVALLDADLRRLQGMNQAGEQTRIQIIGFGQQRQTLALQMRSLQARLQQLAAMMSQTRQPPTPQPRLPQKDGQRGTGPVILPPQPNPQLQIEMRQIQTQLAVLQNQDAQLAANQANAQTQYQRSVGSSQAELEAKMKRREALAQESAMLDQQRVDSANPAQASTPEITDLSRRARLVKTYHDLPLEDRRQELLQQFNCAASRDPAPPAANTQPVEILEKDFPPSRPPR